MDCVPEEFNKINENITAIEETNPASTPDVHAQNANDIGNYVGTKISDFQKFQLLENPWTPPLDYKFPHSIHSKNGKDVKRYLGHQHLNKYNWLVFSPSKQGLFCKFCPWFTVGNVAGGQKTVPLQKLVTKPLTSFAKLLGEKGDLEEHNNKKYHKEAVLSAKSFLHTFKAPNADVRNRIDQQRLLQVEENRSRLKPIIESVIFLGRQNIPFRGHRDDGRLTSTDNGSNEGNFRELLRYRVNSGDSVLEEHFKNSSARATYISKSTQNEIIKCCGEEILSRVVSKVQDAGFYSIIFDETTDLSHKSQISLVLRYYSEGTIHEDFVGFVDAFDEIEGGGEESVDECDSQNRVHDELSLTGEKLGQIVVKAIKKMGLPLSHCVGIGTDGCSVMVSEAKGAVAEMRKEATNAMRCPCFNHALNLSLSKSNSVNEIRNAVGTMKEVTAFFSSSAKRNCVLKKHLGSQLSGLCETRWVERHDCVIQFYCDLEKIVTALDEISKWKDSSASSKASVLSAALTSTTFLVAMICLSDVLSLTLPLSKWLQKPSFDFAGASKLIADTILVLENRRVEATSYFNNLWLKIKELGQKIGVEIKLPRLCGRQTNRANFGVHSASGPDTVQDYYRRSVFAPLLDFIISDLKERFPQSMQDVFDLSFLLPKEIMSANVGSLEKENEDICVEKAVKCFGPLLGISESTAFVLLTGELSIWKQKWKNTSQPTTNLLEVIDECDKDIFPIIRRLLSVIATMPISAASSERSFSALRRLKTWLRSRMSQDRLTGLALLHVHRDLNLSVDKLIDKFANSNRRDKFIL